MLSAKQHMRAIRQFRIEIELCWVCDALTSINDHIWQIVTSDLVCFRHFLGRRARQHGGRRRGRNPATGCGPRVAIDRGVIADYRERWMTERGE
jgi:hypothetical protein